MLSAISTSVAPGKITSHQAPLKSCLLPSLMKVPSEGEVGETPTPRNESVASARIAIATWIVESTSTGPITLGSTWLQHDPQRRHADDPRRLHVLLVPLDHRRAAHGARVLHPARQRDGDDEHAEGERVVGVREERVADAGEQQRDQDRRERQHDVADAHDQRVEPAADVARDAGRG